MSTSGPDPRRTDPRRVRLTWPGGQARAGADPSEVDAPLRIGDLADTVVAAADDVVRAVPVAGADPAGSGALRRAMVDAYDRLAERVLQRLRTVGEDMDADLAELRSEMASLRQAVEDLGDRVQLRQIRATIDELRGDLAGLRRTVLEWPELERVSADITALRADLAELVDQRSREPGGPQGSVAPLAEELVAMRAELALLRRRISLRVGDGTDRLELSDEQVRAIAHALAEHVVTPTGARRRR